MFLLFNLLAVAGFGYYGYYLYEHIPTWGRPEINTHMITLVFFLMFYLTLAYFLNEVRVRRKNAKAQKK